MRGARRRRRREEARRGRRAAGAALAPGGAGRRARRAGPRGRGGAAAADSRRGLRGRGSRPVRGAPGRVPAEAEQQVARGPAAPPAPPRPGLPPALSPRSAPRRPGGRWGCEGRGRSAALPEGSPPRGSGRSAPPAPSPPVTAAVAAAGSPGVPREGRRRCSDAVRRGKVRRVGVPGGPREVVCKRAGKKKTAANKRNGDPTPGGEESSAPRRRHRVYSARVARRRVGERERERGAGNGPARCAPRWGGIGCGRAELSAFERRGNVLRRHFLRCSHRVWRFSARSFFGNLSKAEKSAVCRAGLRLRPAPPRLSCPPLPPRCTPCCPRRAASGRGRGG